MKNIIFTLITLFNFISYSQIEFEQVFSPNYINVDFIDVAFGAVDYADVNNDGNQDVLISGSFSDYPYTFYYVELYIGDGLGNFEMDTSTPFQTADSNNASFIDIDSDNDQDVVVVGDDHSAIYINNGSGVFSNAQATSILGVKWNSIEVADVDQDGDEDLFIIGSTGLHSHSKLYINDGLGNLSESATNSFLGVCFGDIAFADFDNDADLDLFISGKEADVSYPYYLKYYINDGSGLFTEDTSSSFLGLIYSSIAVGDLDNDNDLDILVAGIQNGGGGNVKLYHNDGSGVFTEDANLNSNLSNDYAPVAISDIDGDNDLDIYSTSAGEMFENDGTGNFSLLSSEFIGVNYYSRVAFKDIDNDADEDLVVISDEGSRQYFNEGDGVFSNFGQQSFFVGVDEGNIVYADVDGDDDLDVFISGWNYTDYDNTRYYQNDGTGNYTEVNNTPFIDLYGDIKLIDIDNDNDLDLYISPYFILDESYIFLNDGTGSFNELTNHNINNCGASDFADIDGDNDLDLFVAGPDTNEFYINDGNGIFAVNNFPFLPVIAYKAAVAFIDIDGDNDEDLMISGERVVGWENETRLFLNDGLGNYSLSVLLPEFISGSITFGDVDGDNDQDMLLTGMVEAAGSIQNAEMFINLGDGNFEINCTQVITGLFQGDADFGDVDNDGDLDLILCGASNAGRTTKLYLNNGNGVFDVCAIELPFEPVGQGGDVVFLDFDNDNDEDVLVIGDGISYLYKNGLYELGVDENIEQNILLNTSIYPVPTFGELKVKSKNRISTIEVYNELGHYVLGNSDKEIIDISILTQGLYFVKIKYKNGKSEIKKVLKK